MGMIENLGFLAQAAQRTGPQVSLRDLMAMRAQQADEEERRYQRERQQREDRLMDTPVEVPGVSLSSQRPTQPSDIAGIVNRGRASVGLSAVPDIEAVAARQRGGLGTRMEETEIIPSRRISPRQAAVEKSVRPNLKERLTDAYLAGKIPDAARPAVERLIGATAKIAPTEWSTYLAAAGGDATKALALRRQDQIATAGAKSEGQDALIRHAKYFVQIGVAKDEKEAVALLNQSKTMSRDQFLMSAQKSLLGNPFMDNASRTQAMTEAASWYDQTIGTPQAQPGAGGSGTTFIFRNGQLVPSTGTGTAIPSTPTPPVAPRTPLGKTSQGLFNLASPGDAGAAQSIDALLSGLSPQDTATVMAAVNAGHLTTAEEIATFIRQRGMGVFVGR